MIKLLTLVLAVTPLLTLAHEACLPENNLYISTDIKFAKSLMKKEFNDAINEIESIYGPILKNEYQAKLVVERKWDDGTVNAYAYRKGAEWHVAMFGGLARHPEITKDGFSAVICHELGHHVGGAPKKRSWRSSWAANEGQADYFATSKCLKLLFETQEQKTIDIYNQVQKDPEELSAKKKCDAVPSSSLEAAICYRGALAGKSLARLLGSLSGNANVSFDTPDKSVVAKTYDNHPKAQCRMDTYLQGALCDKDSRERPSQTDASVAYCMREDGYAEGIRPLCWYKP